MRPTDERGVMDEDGVLKLVLVLVALWVGLEILGAILDVTFTLLGALDSIIGLIIIALIVAFLLDRI
ncbi:hypothetical protein DM867_02770 [Halosegnis rubeus]|uniref:Uncharacterized protein n=2 Tax=Halosegnis rubeus TaxID=2212850 RepID=A0A5N5UE60_9EURY|nr:hypothetical protein DM867_02770 [Halosegnis rubeus]KAB7517210.1 hypothetical protein DMP03_04875 [Halosegnis rubeus]KAB7520254.1 hypothetical protein DP108_02640 [Halosegnis rubeus]